MASDAVDLIKDFEKCGEITIAVQFDEKIYALNCIFCGAVCLQLDAFTVHIEDQHAQQLLTIKQMTTTDSEEEILEQREDLSEQGLRIVNAYGGFDAQKERSKSPITNNFDDPLEEPLFTIPVDFQTVVEVKNEDVFKLKPVKDEIQTEVEEHEENVVKPDTIDAESDGGQTDDQDMDNRELPLALITSYEKNRILWDASEKSHKNSKKCDQVVQKMAKSINKKLGMDLNASDVRRHIRTIRSEYRRELRHRNLGASKRELAKYKPLWYYDKLAFLNTSIKYKRPKKQVAKASKDTKPALPLHNLTDAQNHELIEIYKSLRCLWDVDHAGFRFKAQRADAMKQLLQDVKIKMNLDFSQDEVQKMLNAIQYACTQEKYRKLQCERQKETYEPVSKYYNSILFLENTVGPFRCDFCEEIFKSRYQFLIHKSQHDGSMPFVCTICNHGFMDSGNYTVHLRRHTGDFPFECEVCGKRYATSTDVKVHMRYHTGDKPYFCEICGKSCRTWSFFDKHMRRHENRPGHACTICSKAFFENSDLQEHMKGHLNIRDKVCNVCGKTFTRTRYLRLHKQLHAGEKKYSCKLCGKDFAQHAGLTGHIKSHGIKLSSTIAMEKD